MPIVFNEDDNTNFDEPTNDLIVAVREHASWGFYDPGEGACGYHVRSTYTDGFQNVPINWRINTERKRGFFKLVSHLQNSRREGGLRDQPTLAGRHRVVWGV